LSTDERGRRVFKPASYHEKSVCQMLDQVIALGGAMTTLRGKIA
jgi:hypothetical protein